MLPFLIVRMPVIPGLSDSPEDSVLYTAGACTDRSGGTAPVSPVWVRKIRANGALAFRPRCGIQIDKHKTVEQETQGDQ